MSIDALIQRVRAEFEEGPGLELTIDQGARFLGLDLDTCARVLEALHRGGFLVLTRERRYRRADAMQAGR
jgi:hypothetical protein